MTKRQLTTAIQLMRDTRRHIRPDGAWVLRTRHELLKSVRRETIRRPEVSLKERLKALVLAFIPRGTVDLIRGPVMAALSVIGMVLGGSLASVSAAERSVPGDILYPVKLAAEQARLMIEKEPPKKLKLKTEFVGRRAEEMKKIASTDVSKKSERMKEAADIMKKDLDTVKTDLHSVATKESALTAVEAAQDINKMGDQVTQAVKDVRALLPEEAKAQIIEVQTAAVTAGVRAVQVIIDNRADPAVQHLVNVNDLKRSVEEKVLGIEAGIADATKKVEDAVQATPAALGVAPVLHSASVTGTPVPPTARETLKDPIDQLKIAKDSLVVTKESLEKQDLQQVKDSLGQAIKAMTAAEKGIAAAVPEGRASETPVAAPTTTTSTTSTAGTPTSAVTTTAASTVLSPTTKQQTSSSTSASVGR